MSRALTSSAGPAGFRQPTAALLGIAAPSWRTDEHEPHSAKSDRWENGTMETNPRGETDWDARRRRARCRGRARTGWCRNRSIRSTSRAPWSRSFWPAPMWARGRALPMIDLTLSKEKAVGAHIWGLIYDGWAPDPEEQGVTVFLRGTSIVGRTTSESGSTSRQSRRISSRPGTGASSRGSSTGCWPPVTPASR